jgi:hypothetical protein
MVEIANLEFAARGRLQLANDIDGVLVVEIEAGDGVVGFRNLRLFNDPEGAEFGIEFNLSLSLGIVDPACECGCAAGLLRSLVQQRPPAATVEDVVTENQCRRYAYQKFPADQERFRDALKMILDRKRQALSRIAFRRRAGA